MWRAHPELFIAEDFEGLAYREAFSGDMFLATCQQELVVHIEDRMGFWSMATVTSLLAIRPKAMPSMPDESVVNDAYNLSLRVGILKLTEALPSSSLLHTRNTIGPLFRKPLYH